MDNRHYVKGVKHNGELVIPALSHEDKKFLDTFNKEYYNASFEDAWGYDEVHKIKVDKDTVLDIKDQIRTLKRERKKIFNKSPNTTTEDDRALAGYYTEQIDDMENFLDDVHPRRAIENANNGRNRDLLNYAKRSNEYNLVSWETLTDDLILEIDPELHIQKKDDDSEY